MDALQPFGIISIAFLAIGLILTPVLWPLDVRHTFSQHVGRKRSSVIYYIILFTVFLPLFLLFFIGWFVPHFHLPWFVIVFVSIVAITQYACTFIPETSGWRRAWHRNLAAGSAFALIPLVLSLLLIPNSLVQIVSVVCVIVMALLSTVFLHPRLNKYTGESFWIQALYYAAFFLPVLLATYFA